MKKLLILDGISGVPLGGDLKRAFLNIGINAEYYDLAKIPRIALYGVKSGLAKLANRMQDKSGDTFFYLPKGDQKTIERLIQESRPDVILVVGFLYKFIDPAVLRSLADQHHADLYLYDTDSCNLYTKRREFVFFLERELPVYKKIFSCSKVTADFFKKTRKLDASFAPFGSNFIASPTTSDDNKAQDVVFVGSGDLRRILVLESIREHVSIFGNRWKRNFPLMSKVLIERVDDRPVWGDELYKLLTSAKIVLNITRGPYYAAGTGINLRIFEALAAGCFLMTDYCDEIAGLFKPGEEIETFNGPVELQEKVRFYLDHPEQRMQIAKHGHEAFLKHFSWEHRARAMLETMQS
ncbi:glycosyltransferase [Methylobacillus arboreus]|uniref:CgeB family protein n=1 Tax=Methylobacillus arboreus TaxID=755170 RepID=UPI001E54450C|nr:glycosyltransferase [Methylobacillus arboreus]MCB5191590.1 glycosyltransferase [Methylobacillus arboreus]